MILEYSLGLVVFASCLPDKEVSAMLERIKAMQPQIRCIVLVNTVDQQQAAKSAGADAVLLKGFSTKNLLGTVEKFMAEHYKLNLPPAPNHIIMRFRWVTSDRANVTFYLSQLPEINDPISTNRVFLRLVRQGVGSRK